MLFTEPCFLFKIPVGVLVSMQIGRSSKSFYLDDNQFSFTENLRSREVYIIGGFSVGFDKEERELEQQITAVKQKFGLEKGHPVKWNLRDLKKHYDEKGEDELFRNLMDRSDEIRSDLLGILSKEDLGISAFVSAIVRLKRRDKPGISYQRCLTNLLQRLAMNVDSTDQYHSVFLDFFKEDSSEIAACYSNGFHFGRDPEGNSYMAGSLAEKGFSQCLYFGKTIYNPFLQLADLVTGCSKDFIECCLRKKEFGRVCKFFPIVMNRLWKDPGTKKPFKYGLVIAPQKYYEPLEEGYAQVLRDIEDVPF